jgi:hypothetical protein
MILFTLGSQAEYRQFHLTKYRGLAPGIITKVTGDYYGKSGNWTYYNEYRYFINGIPKEGYSTSSYKTYNEGDSVTIAYSREDNDFYEIDEKKN